MLASDYRTILREELETRCNRNPRYSLRAFARDLGLTPARLSEILSRKQGLSAVWADKVATRLGLNSAEKGYFRDLAESEHSRSEMKRRLARVRVAQWQGNETQDLQVDAFKAISDWYHFAILELIDIKGFKSDPKWIGKRLDINPEVAAMAIDRLIRLGLMERKKGGSFRATQLASSVPGGAPSEAVRKYHRQIIEKALTALITDPIEDRDFGSIVFAFDPKFMPEAKDMLKKFRREFSARLGAVSESKTAVFNLSMQFIRVDRDRGEKDV